MSETLTRNVKQVLKLVEDNQELLLSSVPENYREEYVSCVNEYIYSDPWIGRAFARCSPRIFRNSYIFLNKYKQLINDSAEFNFSEQFCEYLHNVFEECPSKINDYYSTIKELALISPWVGECSAQILHVLLKNHPDKLDEYKEVIKTYSTESSVIAGELSEFLIYFYSVSDDVEKYKSIISSMPNEWMSVEVCDYLVRKMISLPEEKREIFLNKVFEVSLTNPLAAAKICMLSNVEPLSFSRKNVKYTKSVYDNFIEWSEDPSGCFDISVFNDEKTIRVRHFVDGVLTNVIEGDSACSLYSTISKMDIISRNDHSCWLGSELMNAENAIKWGIVYSQDVPLNLERKWK